MRVKYYQSIYRVELIKLKIKRIKENWQNDVNSDHIMNALIITIYERIISMMILIF